MSLASLPSELLLIIFRNVFSSRYSTCSSSSCYTCFRIGPNHDAWGPTQSFNPSDPTLFPFALAAVLPHWRDVLSTVPEYWTRPVFFLVGTTADIDVAEILICIRRICLWKSMSLGELFLLWMMWLIKERIRVRKKKRDGCAK